MPAVTLRVALQNVLHVVNYEPEGRPVRHNGDLRRVYVGRLELALGVKHEGVDCDRSASDGARAQAVHEESCGKEK